MEAIMFWAFKSLNYGKFTYYLFLFCCECLRDHLSTIRIPMGKQIFKITIKYFIAIYTIIIRNQKNMSTNNTF